MDVFLGMVGGEAVRRKPQMESNIFFYRPCWVGHMLLRTCAYAHMYHCRP